MTLYWDVVCKYIHQPSVTTQGGCAVQKSLFGAGTQIGLIFCLCSNPPERGAVTHSWPGVVDQPVSPAPRRLFTPRWMNVFCAAR